MLKTCRQCGKEFVAERARRVYCSFACNGASKVGNPDGKYGRHCVDRASVTCLQCGKVFEVTDREVEKGRVYCGRDCFKASRFGKKRAPYKGHEPTVAACAVCSAEFLVGGRNGRRKGSQFCSRACRHAARKRRCGALCKELTETQAAYIAGIVDGEGSIMLVARKSHLGAYLRVAICNTHRGVLDWVSEKTGIGGITEVDNEKYGRSKKKGYFWKTHGDAALSVLLKISPFLIIKKRQSDMAIEFQQRLQSSAPLRADKSWQLEWMAKMKAMNERSKRPKKQEANG